MSSDVFLSLNTMSSAKLYWFHFTLPRPLLKPQLDAVTWGGGRPQIRVSAGKSAQLLRVRISFFCHLTAIQKSHTLTIERDSYNAAVR